MTDAKTPNTIPDATKQPREFLEHLYRAAVTRALPLENTARYLPKPHAPESGGRTIPVRLLPVQNRPGAYEASSIASAAGVQTIVLKMPAASESLRLGKMSAMMA